MNKQSKNVSQSTNRAEIVLAIQELNPNVDISLGDPRFVVSNRLFYCSVPAEKLILPEGFYYNEKNGITNKHNTDNGLYCSLDVEDLSMANENTLMPKVDTIVKREVPNSEQEKQNVKDIIISAIQKIKNKIMGKGDSNAKSR